MRIVLACLTALFLTGCFDEPRESGARAAPPVLLIGVDGLEWSVVAQMLEAGRLPVLAGILERGSYGKLAVSQPTLSPILWSSIATGTPPEEHGIRGFVHAPAGASGQRLYTSADRRRKAFWNVTSEAGIRTWVIGWWLSFPVEPIEGIMVAQVNTVTPAMRRAGKGVWKGHLVPGLEGQVHPREIEERVLAAVPAVEASLEALELEIFGQLPADLGPIPRRLLEQSRWALRADALYLRVARDLLASQPAPRCLAIYFGGPDVIGHRFWRYMEPERYENPPDPHELQALGDMVRAYYAWVDGAIGAILAAASDESTVVVVSDHGMHAANVRAKYRSHTLSGGHLDAPPAFFATAGSAIRKVSEQPVTKIIPSELPTLGSLLDVAPTLLALLGAPIGDDMRGEALTSLFEPAFLAAHPIRSVERHTPPGWRPDLVSAAETPASGERLEQLRALGYLN